MKATLQQYIAKFEQLSVREKVLGSASLSIAIVLGWFLLISEPLYLGTKQARTENEAMLKNIAELNKQLQSLQQRKLEDPQRELKQRIVQLDANLEQLDVELRSKLHGLIDPRQMAEVLESVLKQNKDLVLIRVKSLDAVPLITAGSDAADADTKAPRVEIYRHGMQVEFEGSYLATLEYLKTLETLPWEFYWDAVQLDVEEYPRARIVITVHTLSLRDAWIGV